MKKSRIFTVKNNNQSGWKWTWKNLGLIGIQTLTFVMAAGRNAPFLELIKPTGEQAIVSS